MVCIVDVPTPIVNQATNITILKPKASLLIKGTYSLPIISDPAPKTALPKASIANAETCKNFQPTFYIILPKINAVMRKANEYALLVKSNLRKDKSHNLLSNTVFLSFID